MLGLIDLSPLDGVLLDVLHSFSKAGCIRSEVYMRGNRGLSSR